MKRILTQITVEKRKEGNKVDYSVWLTYYKKRFFFFKSHEYIMMTGDRYPTKKEALQVAQDWLDEKNFMEECANFKYECDHYTYVG